MNKRRLEIILCKQTVNKIMEVKDVLNRNTKETDEKFSSSQALEAIIDEYMDAEYHELPMQMLQTMEDNRLLERDEDEFSKIFTLCESEMRELKYLRTFLNNIKKKHRNITVTYRDIISYLANRYADYFI